MNLSKEFDESWGLRRVIRWVSAAPTPRARGGRGRRRATSSLRQQEPAISRIGSTSSGWPLALLTHVPRREPNNYCIRYFP